MQAARASPEVAADYERYGGQGRVTHLVADLEALGAVARLETKPGRVDVLLRVDKLERLVGEGGRWVCRYRVR